jgi:hypothetical protein
MKEMVKHVPDAGSYAPITLLVDERPDGVHLGYDKVESVLAPYENASPAEPDIFPSGSNRPFVPGFPPSVLGSFGLCGRSLSLWVISGGASLRPKIPFLADKARWRGLC